jgi:uncharacterized membrane protein
MSETNPELGEPSARNIEAIAALERAALRERSAFDRFSEVVTNGAGSATFLAIHAAWFVIWIAVNEMRQPAFDPFPFNFLMLIVALEAIFLTGMVLMAQNRMTRQADKRAHLDLQVNLLAEQELTAMLQMLHALCQQSGVTITARDTRVEQLLKETDIHTIATALDQKLTENKPAERPVANS